MTRNPASPPPEDNPLAGVLDRLLARERGKDRPPSEESYPAPLRPAAGAATRLACPHAARRMLVIAGLGEDRGRAALRAAARWGIRIGKRPAVVELACGESAPHRERRTGPPATDKPRLPFASLPYGPERLRAEAPEVIVELLERLRRHESACDLLLVRIPARRRMVLMRAALLAGGIIVPLDESGNVLHEALHLSREIVESFLDLVLWPFSSRPRELGRYMEMMRDFVGIQPRPFEEAMEEGASALDGLQGAPEEGFLAAILAPDEDRPPSRLLQTGYLRL